VSPLIAHQQPSLSDRPSIGFEGFSDLRVSSGRPVSGGPTGLRREARLMRLLGWEALPDPDTLGVAAVHGGCADRASETRGAGAGARHPECMDPAARRAREVHVGCGGDALIEEEKRDHRWSNPGVREYMPLRGGSVRDPGLSGGCDPGRECLSRLWASGLLPHVPSADAGGQADGPLSSGQCLVLGQAD
jgi:hypothetical protein